MGRPVNVDVRDDGVTVALGSFRHGISAWWRSIARTIPTGWRGLAEALRKRRVGPPRVPPVHPARRTRAAIAARLRKAHNDNAIRVPPGTSSSIAAYGPIARNAPVI